jgi:TonB family protein
MKRAGFVLACLAVACATPNGDAPSVPAASTPSANVSSVSAGPAACPARTETLYVPQMPEPGFIPAAPRGANVVAPKRLLAAEPEWPAASTRCREQGKVTITYCVSATGAVENVQVVISSGFARLDNAVLAWATRDRHTPGTVNGRARLYCGMKMEQEFDLPEAAIGLTAR